MSGAAHLTNVVGGVKVAGNRKIVNTDYEALKNKPRINGIELDGDKSAADLGLGDATDYEALENKPKINGVPLEGDLSSDDLHIEGGADLEFEEGDVDGAFSVVKEGGEPQSVKVHGLQEHSLTDALTYDEVLTILDHDDDDVEAEDDTE